MDGLVFLVFGVVLVLVSFPGQPVISEDAAPPRDCVVANLRTQAEFEPVQFEGLWYVVSDQGMFAWQHALDKLAFLTQDYKAFYTMQEDGTMRVLTGGRWLGRCAASVGVLRPEGALADAKFLASYDSWWLHGRGATPFWVAATNYDSWALIYSCRGVLADGTCDPGKTFAWTLNRKADGHTDEEQAAVNAAAADVCLPAAWTPMPRTRPCPEIQSPEMDDDDEEKTEL